MKPVIPLVLAFALCGGAALADDGWLGVQLQTLDPDLTKALQLPDDQGVLVDEVVGESPAEKAGLKHGDVIVAFEGSPVREVKDLTKAVRKASPGDEVAITVLRDGKRQDLAVTLGAREDRNVYVLRQGDGDGVTAWTGKDGDNLKILAGTAGGYLGIGMQDLTEQLGKHFGVEGGKGVLVSEVKPDTPAAGAGIEAGDVIVKADGQEVSDGSGLRDVLAKNKPGDEVVLAVIRDGRTRDVTVKLAEWPEMSWTGDKAARVYIDRLRGDLPRMREFMPPEALHELHMSRPDADVEGLREEIEQLRKDLDEMRQELKNR
jgi:serine protease Do